MVSGGITPAERSALKKHAQMWIERAYRIDPIEPDKIVPAITRLYRAAGLRCPRVVITPSPMMAVFACGAAAAIWRKVTDFDAKSSIYFVVCRRAHEAVERSTDKETYIDVMKITYKDVIENARGTIAQAIRDAVINAVRDTASLDIDHKDAVSREVASLKADHQESFYRTYRTTATAIKIATGRRSSRINHDTRIRAAHIKDTVSAAVIGAASACYDLAGSLGITCAKRWNAAYEGGNLWAPYECFITAMRDVLGLRLPEHNVYRYWEEAAIHGGFRLMHSEFCIVCDFPEVIRVDAQHRPHCADGPSLRWRDGWSLYHWHGVPVPRHWIEQRDTLDPAEVLRAENVEQRAAGAAIVGWPKMINKLERRIIDGDPDSDMGALIELTLPGLPQPGRFLQARCPRNGIIVEGVPRISDIDGLPIDTVIAAQAWRVGDPQSEYVHPPKRT
jgi:hypothetical protein